MTLNVSFSNYGALFKTNSFDNADGLPSYKMTVTDVGSSTPIPLSYGSTTRYYSDSGNYDAYDTDYQNSTTTVLTPGATYEAYLQISTVGYTDCSIYYSDGCHQIKAATEAYRWRFTYTGSSVAAAAYTAPSNIDLGTKKHARAHGWKITAVLTVEGAPLANAEVKGQVKVGHRRWRGGSILHTNAQGEVHATFPGNVTPSQFRFFFEGIPTVSGTYSKPFSITRRR